MLKTADSAGWGGGRRDCGTRRGVAGRSESRTASVAQAFSPALLKLINLVLASLNSAVSILAATGSPCRCAYTLSPDFPKTTRSSFLPSSNFATTVAAGESSPVFAVDSTNVSAFMLSSFVRRAATLSLSTSPALGLTRRHFSGSVAASLPSAFAFSNATV